MKIWQLQIPHRAVFADLLDIYVETTHYPCNGCKKSELPNLLVEWEDGSDKIGDFVSPLSRIVARESVADQIINNLKGFKKVEIEMFDHPNLYRPKKRNARTPKRVWLPYTGPPLCELQTTKKVTPHKKSTVVIENQCSKCGSLTYKRVEGLEERDSRGHTPRTPGMGFFITKDEIGDYDFFSPKYTGYTLCTDRAKEFIESQNFSNIEFLEAGNVIEK